MVDDQQTQTLPSDDGGMGRIAGFMGFEDSDGFRDSLVARVAELGYPTDDIRIERLTDPVDWEAQGMEKGTPFALALVAAEKRMVTLVLSSAATMAKKPGWS